MKRSRSLPEDNDPVRFESTPVSVLVTLSLACPGSAQLVNGQRKKGWVLIVMASVLAGIFLILMALMFMPMYDAWALGKNPDFDEQFFRYLTALAVTLLVGLFVSFYALVDALVVAGKHMREGRHD